MAGSSLGTGGAYAPPPRRQQNTSRRRRRHRGTPQAQVHAAGAGRCHRRPGADHAGQRRRRLRPYRRGAP